MRIRQAGRCLAPLVLIAMLGCDDAAAPTSPSPAGKAPGTGGATPVGGTERLAWNQAGDRPELRFRLYVDELPVDLTSATCDDSTPAACTSPLPPLRDGVHTLALVNVDASGVESARTDTITVQKVSTRAATLAALLLGPTGASGALRLEVEIDAGDGFAFTADVVARDIHGPAQLVSLPDGRLLAAQADGLVRVIHPGQSQPGEPALDARNLLQPSPIGPLGIARHRDFIRNRFVYVSFVEPDPPAHGRLRIVRLREVSGRLGEPASLYEARVAVALPAPADTREKLLTREGPRMAFGPDGLLYVALPVGLEFQNEPAASKPRAAMLRLSDAGRLPAAGVLTGIDAHPLGFTWHPATNALWAMFPGQDGEAVLRTFGPGTATSAAMATRSGLRTMIAADRLPVALAAEGSGASVLPIASVVSTAPGVGTERAVRLTLPVVAGRSLVDPGSLVGDCVIDGEGTLFLITSNTSAGNLRRADVVVQLKPSER
jgi:hypothetical protein